MHLKPRRHIPLSFSAALLLITGLSHSQQQTAIGTTSKQTEGKNRELAATTSTQREARTMRLSIPAPRGLITDRNGVALAQNRVVYYLALNFPFMEKASPEKILSYGKTKIQSANQLLGKKWAIPDEKLISHYTHRRWLPLVFSIENGVNVPLSDDDQDRLKPMLEQGALLLQPAYVRTYPKQESACHILGYSGRTRRLPEGPIIDGDPLFEEIEGRSGLEDSYDNLLKGIPGEINLLFDADGKLLSDEVLRRPTPGNTVVTTLDYRLQRHAESALRRHASYGGAMVIMDIRNGEILAMASNPNFNPNEFVFGIGTQRWDELNDDNKRKPLYARAFSGEYPPASTFKIVTALGAMETGKVSPDTYFGCPPALHIGDRYFHNHNTKSDEGDMNVVGAIKRSCNTWFYRCALNVGSDAITDMALKLGFAEKTGIPLKGESAGRMPTSAHHRIAGGELANISIGQGTVTCTPLQVCQSMAAVGDGNVLRQPILVKQVQDIQENILEANEPKIRRQINLNPTAREAVIKGMIAVVSGSGGTGHAAAIKKAQIAGKTGTAQWRPAKDQNLAWFTGFLPAKNPVLAFAVVYEGRPGENISGGREAAPIVHEVFTRYYENVPADDPLLAALQAVPDAKPVEEDGTEDNTPSRPKERVRKAQTAQAPTPPPQAQRGVKGFFKRLFTRD
jgi:penicillin-binding protein 2